MKSLFRTMLAACALLFPLHAQADSVFMEDLTWMQVRDRIQSGAKIAIIPTGGTEQNGPHMILAKHNLIVRYTSGEVARKLGNALVSPVIAHVPEGRISPPEGHMQFAGTISVSQDTFAALLEDTARSMKQHGFRLICFIGDHGGSQDAQSRIANKLTQEWRADNVHVINVSDYYMNNGQDKWVESMGIRVVNPAAHAGFADTSELMAIYAGGVIDAQRGPRADHDYRSTGAMGDSSLSSARYGQKLLNLKIEAAIAQIQNASVATY
jgi:creatinine amidohydrolase/Fe(II)-dependent formamide hydrolase-like protein